jgi:GTPase SAR1 family protein
MTSHFVEGESRKKSDSKAPPYYKGAHGVILVYDVTSKDSFDDVTDIWLKDVKKFTDKKRTQLLILANKCDKKRLFFKSSFYSALSLM